MYISPQKFICSNPTKLQEETELANPAKDFNLRKRFDKRNSRSTLNAQGAHAVHAHLTHVHALVGDLDHATLEVLLVEHVHLVGENAQEDSTIV